MVKKEESRLLEKAVTLIVIPLLTGFCGVGISLAFKLHEMLVELSRRQYNIEQSISVLQARYDIESVEWREHVRKTP